jgi:hypothetical protein
LRKGTYFDHEAGKGGGVLDLVRRVKGFENGDAIKWLREEGILVAEASSREEKFIEAEYDYTDEHGKLIFQAVRYGYRRGGSRVVSEDGKPKKSFAQRRPDGSSWVWNLKDVRPVPYRLPQLIEAIADDRTIFIPEGEKCVDRLIAAGLAATCNAAGAGKWREELTEHFAGAKVVILPDNDEAGRNHGALVAEKLKGTAESIVILDLPDLLEKEDVFNWLETGHTANELQELVATKGRLPGEGPAAQPQQVIRATPFRWREPCSIPPRQFLYGRHLARGYVSVTGACGGVGKTSLKIVEAIALGTGRDLLCAGVPAPVTAWYLGLEDPLVEYERRVSAAGLHYGIPGSELEAGLFLDSGRDQNFVIATEERSGVKIAQPIVDAIIANVRDRDIGSITVDPFVASHAVGENDNTRIEKVTREWARIAEVADCAVELIHHLRKSNGAEPSVDDLRGGTAVPNASRSVRILAQMTKEEASQANVSDRRRFFRVMFGKANMFLPPDTAQWCELKTVSLGNGNGGPDDEIQVATRWAWPNALDGLQVADLEKVQDRIAAGEWADNAQADDWAGYAVAEVLGLNVSNKADNSRIKSLLRTWLKAGALKVARIHSSRHGRERPMIVIGAR